MAVATTCRDVAQQGRRVSEKRKRGGEQAKGGAQKPEGRRAAQECSIKKSSHAPFCASFLEKTDSAERLRVLLPGFWNLAGRGNAVFHCNGAIRLGIPK